MTKREWIAHKSAQVPDQDLDKLLAFLRTLHHRHEELIRTPAAESSLEKDWLTAEEDAAWASLYPAAWSSSHSLSPI